MVSEAGGVLVGGGLVHNFPNRRPSDSFRRTYYGSSPSPRSQADLREPKKLEGERV